MNAIEIQHQKELKIHEELREIGQRLDIQIPELLIGIRLIDGQTGKTKFDLVRHSHSYVRNAAILITTVVGAESVGGSYVDGNLNLKSIAGALEGIEWMSSETSNGFVASANNDVYGCLVGRGTAAESFDDFEMDNLVTHGAGLNQMEYGAVADSGGWNAGSSYWWRKYSRPIDNNSGAGITCEEIGLAWQTFVNNEFLAARDLISGGLLVPDGDRLYVDYELRMSY